MIFDLLPVCALVIQGILGLAGCFVPHMVSEVVGIKSINLAGRAEIRAVFGGFLLGGALAGMYLQTHSVYILLGTAWLFAALARVLSLKVDQSSVKENYLGIVIEIIIALMLFSGLKS